MVSQQDAAPLLQVEEELDGKWLTSSGRRVRLLGGALSAALLVCVGAAAAVGPARIASLNEGGLSVLTLLKDKKDETSKQDNKCTYGRGNCNVTQCCASSGMQCYEQDGSYAQCRVDCIEGAPDPSHWNGNKWSCKELGTRTEGKPACGKPGEDCSKSQCCADPGMQCYEKTEGWATCKADCMPGAPDMTDANGDAWSCKELGERAPGRQDWVQEQCSVNWDDCTKTMCCKNPGEQCHLADSENFGECFPIGSCVTDGWSCTPVGYPTPGAPQKGAMVPKWAMSKCGKLNEGCLESKCCLGMDVQCYEKNDDWAMCMQSCEPGKHKDDDDNGEWTCKPIGPISYGMATKGFPSLYCFSVFQIDGYEQGLIQINWDKKAGIFACDDYDLLTQDGSTKIGDVDSIQFAGAEIVTSIDGTAGNTFLFVNAWNAVIDSNKWNNHAFTCKVDPDAVFVPDRVRWHVMHYVDEDMFVINCHVGDMIYGALEVYSFKAIQVWAAKKDDCNTPNNFGEDKYMTQCMDHLGVYRVHDESIMGDKLCGTYSDCSNQRNAAFHPFKDPGSFTECMDITMGWV